MDLIEFMDIASFQPDRLKYPDAWIGHIPFAAWIIRTIKPSIFVELGTHSGNSYFSFCQSVNQNRLETRCFAVDTWKGDEHSGFYGEEIYEDVRFYNDKNYPHFSSLLRMTFDDAAQYFPEGSIDLLHIDGLHTYKAVKHDFETWLPKLSDHAVVLFHDTNVKERDFGVWRLWQELCEKYPLNFEFIHSYGLGVLQIAKGEGSFNLEWLSPDYPHRNIIREYFSSLGLWVREKYLKLDAEEHNQNIEALQRKIDSNREHVARLEAQLAEIRETRLTPSKELIWASIGFIERALEEIHMNNLYALEYSLIKKLLEQALSISEVTFRIPLQVIAINFLQRVGEREIKDKLIMEFNRMITLPANQKIYYPIKNYIDWIEKRDEQYQIAKQNFDLFLQSDDLFTEIEKKPEIFTSELLDIIRQNAINSEMEGKAELSKGLFELMELIYKVIPELSQPNKEIESRTPNENQQLLKILNALIIDTDIENKGEPLYIAPISPSRIIQPHTEPIDIIICVHNAFYDVKKCLTSVINNTNKPYQLIIIDDGSDVETKEFLQKFQAEHDNSTLIRNDKARGYTRAANQGMKYSNSDYLVLLNSDTIVGPDWLDGLYSTMISDKKNGVVGPLSNTASWQSIPKLTENGDWAENPLPDSMSVDEMSQLIGKYSARLKINVPLLNGFCLMIRRSVIDSIGYFNEEVFGDGYGEEDDFNIRAIRAGWQLSIADDVYIYHAQSKSYSHDRRHELAQKSGINLRKLHGKDVIDGFVNLMNPNRVLEGIRARSAVIPEIENYNNRGMDEYSEKKVLFVLPVHTVGGGANVVIDEARCMRNMGVDAQIFNHNFYKDGFLRGYPHLDIPVIFGNPKDLVRIGVEFDAVIATANFSVEWLKPFEGKKKPVLGYYIQDFEPLMFKQDSDGGKKALDSYTLIKNIKSFTKTSWTQQTVFEHTRSKSEVIGISINIDLFRPRDNKIFGQKPIKVVAMIRADSEYRNPIYTLEVLRQIKKEFKQNVIVQVFGTSDIRYANLSIPLDFDFEQYGILTQLQVANLLSNADIFVDFSTHQAMGLTALEAMACGCAVIVPQNGGAIEFVQDGVNGIVVNSDDEQMCYNALRNLIQLDEKRRDIQLSGIHHVVQYYPEKAAYNTLNYLFGEPKSPSTKRHHKKVIKK